MLHVTIISVGKLKERYLTEACAEYLKRLTAYCKPAVIEIDEYRLPQNPSHAEIGKCVESEGQSILAKLPKGSQLCALCIESGQLSSQEFAVALQTQDASHIAFVIGGSHGLSDAVKAAAHRRLSMSKMTFPHQLARVMLLEQIYRGFSINSGSKYHK